MAFKGGGLNPNTTSVTAPQGTGRPRTPGLTSTAVPTTIGPDTPKSKPVLSPEGGLFGGSLPPSRKGTEKRAELQGDARRFESFHPNSRQPGPFVLGEQGTGAIPIHPLPRFAAEIFAEMLRGPQR
jgi:hypothetical protein